MERKRAELLQGFKEVLHRKKGIFCLSPKWALNGKGSELPFDAIEFLPEWSHCDVHEYVTVYTCQFKKEGGAGVS